MLLTWVITGLLTVAAALSYGELAAMMPKAGGQYVFLREAWSPLWGFLYGWTLFLVIQSGTIAAEAVAFARYLGVLAPAISPTRWIVPPIDLSARYALSLSTQQMLAILMIVARTWINIRGLALGKLVQNVFTSAKTLSLLALIVLGIVVGRSASAINANFSHAWTPPDRLRTLSRENQPNSLSHGALDIFEILCKVNGKSCHKPAPSHHPDELHRNGPG